MLADAQPSGRIYRIGWLGHGNAPSKADRGIADFLQGLRDLGYVDGKDVTVESRFANGNVERLPELARLKVDVIVTSGEPAALAAKRATRAIPVVAMEFALDPVKSGLVASLARPEGNVTGLTSISEELWQKRLELLKALVPKLSRVVVLWNPANPGNAYCMTEIRTAAKAMGVQLHPLEARDANGLQRAFADTARESPDALVLCWDGVSLEHARSIGDFALLRRLPTLAPLKEYVQAGSLLSFGASLPAHRRRAAYYVGRILKGSKPSDLPVERPTHFELVVNVTTAKVLGLALPSTLSVLADDLIE
jgi:putative ABC transport system substrate-binding protein